MSDQHLPLTYIEFPCLMVKQPIGSFYVGVIQARDLVTICYADVRKIINSDLDTVLGIQRPLNPKRVDELKEYVQMVDASFPTSIILATKSTYASFNESSSHMRMLRRTDAALVLDGQHRIAGLEGFDEEFQLAIVLFVDMDIEDQAHLFATINLKQTKINRSLMFDLFDYAKSRSPQRTCHDLVRILNKSSDSALRGRVKILGVADGGHMQLLTQAALVSALLPFVSKNPDIDRDRQKRKWPIEKYSLTDLRKHPWRNLYVDENDAAMLALLRDYFEILRSKWPEAWQSKEKGSMLNRTNGVVAFLKLLKAYCGKRSNPSDLPSKAELTELFERIKFTDADFSVDNFPPGSSGEFKLLRELEVFAFSVPEPDVDDLPK